MSGMTTPPPSNGTDFSASHPNSAGKYEYDADGRLLGPKAEAPVEQPRIKIRKKLEPDPGSQLSLLFTQLPEMEARKKEAEDALTAHKKKIQQAIADTITDPNDTPDQFDIPADPFGGYPAYTLAARSGAWRLDSEAMKTQEPTTWQKWAKQGQPYWELSRVRKNRVKR